MEVCVKHIMLVDNELKIIQHVLNHTDWIVEVLVTMNRDNPYVNVSRVKKIYTEEDFLKNRDLSSFDYHDLDYLWHAQLKVENCFQRFLVDYQMGKWNYYRGYALVKKIYDKAKLDLVIVKGFNHGYTWDRLITDFATYKNINSYNIETMLLYTRGVYNNYTRKLIRADESSNVDVSRSLFYKESYENNRPFNKGLWNWIYKWNYQLFGSLGVDIIKCIRYRDFGEDRFGVTIQERAVQYGKIRAVKRYVDSISVKPDFKKKYICYALHFEPEATVAGRADMDSQIVAIQMIASNLPPDWILYVKEHPFQYEVNRSDIYWDLYGVAVFKTRRFYEEIHCIKNVRLLKSETSSKMILKRCQAIATFSGTIAAEATRYKKPVMIFSSERTVFHLASGFYKICSYEDCKKAIQKIMRKEPVNYDDFEKICKQYFIDFKDESSGFKKAIDMIQKDVMEQKENLSL